MLQSKRCDSKELLRRELRPIPSSRFGTVKRLSRQIEERLPPKYCDSVETVTGNCLLGNSMNAPHPLLLKKQLPLIHMLRASWAPPLIPL